MYTTRENAIGLDKKDISFWGSCTTLYSGVWHCTCYCGPRLLAGGRFAESSIYLDGRLAAMQGVEEEL